MRMIEPSSEENAGGSNIDDEVVAIDLHEQDHNQQQFTLNMNKKENPAQDTPTGDDDLESGSPKKKRFIIFAQHGQTMDLTPEEQARQIFRKQDPLPDGRYMPDSPHFNNEGVFNFED